jgi:hypothetical protein
MLAGIEARPSHFDRVHESAEWSLDPRLAAAVLRAMTGMQESRYVCAKAENDLEALIGVFREVCIKSLELSVEEASAVASAMAQDMMPSRVLRLAPKDEPGTIGGVANPHAFPDSPNRERPLDAKEHPGMIGAVPMDDPTGKKKVDPSAEIKDADPLVSKPWARRGRRSKHR